MTSWNISTNKECFSRNRPIIFNYSLCKTLGEVMIDKQSFWKKIIEAHVSSCYNMVTIHKNYFEDLLANDTPTGDTMIEFTTGRAIQDIPIKELLPAIKDIYENSRIVDTVEIDDEDMIIYHNYRNQEAIYKLKRIILALLENSGHSYDAKLASNMIILKHIPNAGIQVQHINI